MNPLPSLEYPVEPFLPRQRRKEASIDRIYDLALICVRAAEEKKAEDIVVLDISRIVPLADYFIIASGKNKKQVQAIADEIATKMKAAGARRLGIEGHEEGTWVCLDYGDLIVHLFLEDVRSYYELESLWADAPRVAWEAAAKATGT